MKYIAWIDTPAGVLCLLVVMMLIGTAMEIGGLPKGQDVQMQSFGALLLAIRNHIKSQE